MRAHSQLTQLARSERELPPLFNDGTYDPTRIRFYLEVVVAHPGIRGGDNPRAVYCEFVAAMIVEAGLNNLTLGNNAAHRNVTSEHANTFVGVSWCQLDTGYHVADLDALHWLRADPRHPLDYIGLNDDLTYQGTDRTWFNTNRWHGWNPEDMDPTDKWSPWRATTAMWDQSLAPTVPGGRA
jgi:hypothetical protein